jgi:hypothetical protein
MGNVHITVPHLTTRQLICNLLRKFSIIAMFLQTTLQLQVIPSAQENNKSTLEILLKKIK